MIKLGPRPKTPASLSGRVVANKKHELAEKVAGGGQVASIDFPSLWLNEDVREPLWKIHHGKCCYCERKRDIKRESDIEHFRPKAKVTGVDHPGYWWLAYQWENYLFSCKTCNETHKGNIFPLQRECRRARRPEDEISLEEPLLLNPIDDDPEQCITYDWWSGGSLYVKAIGMDEEGRGAKTIEILDLNRLMEDRAANLTLLKMLAHKMIRVREDNNRELIEETAADIKRATSATREYCGFSRALFKSFGLEQYIAND